MLQILRLTVLLVHLQVGLGAANLGVAAGTPNVVLIISDDQAWTDYGFMGNDVIRTPRLDQLARQSLVYPRGYVPSSLCRPSLATIITGQFPHQHKITSNDPPLPRGPKFLRLRQEMIDYIDHAPTLPRLLAERNYLSHQSGKWWEGNFRRGGFTHGMTHGDPRRRGRHGDVGLKIGREGMQPIFDFIDQAGDKPFFLWYAPFLPHTPHNPPARLLEKYRNTTDSIYVAKYRAMCERFDETCGQLLDHLDRRGLHDNTLVVFVTDNGWINLKDRSAYAPKSKRSPYDGGLRTPIMIRWPAKLAPDRIDVPVSSIDLAPTILAACGVTSRVDLPGINLLDRQAVSQRQAIFGEVFSHNADDIHDPASSLQYRWCVADRWKLIVPHSRNITDEKPELYDLKTDPHETLNLAPSHPERVEQLRTLVDSWWSVSDSTGGAGG